MHAMVDKITRQLASYLAKQKIVALEPIVKQIEAHDAAYKLAFIKAHMCPRARGLRAEVEDLLRKNDVTVPTTTVDRIEQFLVALCELAEQ